MKKAISILVITLGLIQFVYSGSTDSVWIDIPVSSSIQTQGDGLVNLPAATYIFSMYVKLDSSTSISSFETYIGNKEYCTKWAIDTIQKNNWVKLSQELKVNSNINNQTFTIHIENATHLGGGTGTFYIDDISFTPKDTTSHITSGNTIPYKLYPNPVSESLMLHSEQRLTYELYNSSGVLIKKMDTPEIMCIIRTTEFPKGLYLMHIKVGALSMIERVIIR